MSEKRIGVVGAGGTGKSGLASILAERLGIAYVAAKSITRPILERKGYDWSSGTFVEEFLAQEECQQEILAKTIELEKTAGGFVTDRTPVDLAAYAIIMLHKKVSKVDDMVAACYDHVKNYTHLIFCPWGQQPIERNEVRTLNPWFQFAVHGAMMALLKQWDLKYLVISATGDDRVREALEYIAPKRRVQS